MEATEPTLRLQPPVAGEQTGGFAADHLAYNATTRDWRTHEGLDLAAALGDGVRTISLAGTVTALLDQSMALFHTLACNVRAEQAACRRVGKHDAAVCSAADGVPAQLEQRRDRRAGLIIHFHISSFPFLRWIIARIIPQILRRGYYDFLFFAQFRRQTLFSIHIH